MNVSITKSITEKELEAALAAMAKEKVPGHDGIFMEFVKQLWSTLEDDYLKMILQVIQNKTLHVEVTKGHIILISNEGDLQNLNYWRPITLLTSIYKICAKTLLFW